MGPLSAAEFPFPDLTPTCEFLQKQGCPHGPPRGRAGWERSSQPPTTSSPQADPGAHPGGAVRRAPRAHLVSPRPVLYFNVYVNILIILFCFYYFYFFLLLAQHVLISREHFVRIVSFFFFFFVSFRFICSFPRFCSARFNLLSCKYSGTGRPWISGRPRALLIKIDFTA